MNLTTIYDLQQRTTSARDHERVHEVRQHEPPRELLGALEYLYGSKIRAHYYPADDLPIDLGDYYTEAEALAAIHGAATVQRRHHD